jgi:hypothetical protein
MLVKTTRLNQPPQVAYPKRNVSSMFHHNLLFSCPLVLEQIQRNFHGFIPYELVIFLCVMQVFGCDSPRQATYLRECRSGNFPHSFPIIAFGRHDVCAIEH